MPALCLQVQEQCDQLHSILSLYKQAALPQGFTLIIRLVYFAKHISCYRRLLQ